MRESRKVPINLKNQQEEIMRKKISICFLAIAITLGTYYIAYGVSSYKTAFNTKYGTTGTVLDQCILCHTTNTNPNANLLNPYGLALQSNGVNFTAAEPLDSDGDGFNNITEINARTFPGNSASIPTTTDTTPNPFTFIDQTGVALNTVVTSNTITVAGINAAAPISITGGTYSVNGGAYTSTSGTVNNGNMVAVRVTSSGSNSTTVNATLTIGGVSDIFSVTTTAATTDSTAPTVTAFSIPATSTSLTVPITAFAATDNVGVTGYMVNESATKPLATAAGWTTTVPASYTFATAGAKTLYAWAKDAAGNVSNSRSASTTISLSQPSQGPTFSNPTAITNLYLPLANLNQDIFDGTTGGRALHVERTLMGNTKNFTVGNQTVATLVVEERSFVDNVLHEVALSYFAQGDDGTVYSFGETVNVYDGSGNVVGHQGSWLYGVDTNQLGIAMPASPRARMKFQAHNVSGVTISNATVARIWRVTVPAGRFRRCIRITETFSDGTVEQRYYAPNVGLIKEIFPGGSLSLTSHGQTVENGVQNNLENNMGNDVQK